MWNEDLSVNIEKIDRQHKKLVDLLTELTKAMRNGEGHEVLGAILEDLVAYTRFHFSTEEKLMKEHDFPGYEEHKEKHSKMTQKVLDLQKQYENGKHFMSVEVLAFLENWIKKHIAGTDKAYSSYLNEKGVF